MQRCDNVWLHRRRLPLLRFNDEEENVVNNFIDVQLETRVIALKNKLDDMTDLQKKRGRYRASALESVGTNIFLNRAALKLAEMDAELHLLNTSARLALKQETSLSIADLCGGPGGFVDYMLWRVHKQHDRKNERVFDAIGSIESIDVYGLTLPGDNEYASEFPASSAIRTSILTQKREKMRKGNTTTATVSSSLLKDNFVPFLGDISDVDDVAEYKSQFESKEVQLVVADGGVDFRGVESLQELVSLPLLIQQLRLAIEIVCDNGIVLCKTFASYTLATIEAIFLASCCFTDMTMIKPLSSRPSNSEQYIVLFNRRDKTTCRPFLEQLDVMLEILSPLNLIMDAEFISWMTKVNFTHTRSQIQSLEKMTTDIDDGKGKGRNKGGKGSKGGRGGKGHGKKGGKYHERYNKGGKGKGASKRNVCGDDAVQRRDDLVTEYLRRIKII